MAKRYTVTEDEGDGGWGCLSLILLGMGLFSAALPIIIPVVAIALVGAVLWAVWWCVSCIRSVFADRAAATKAAAERERLLSEHHGEHGLQAYNILAEFGGFVAEAERLCGEAEAVTAATVGSGGTESRAARKRVARSLDQAHSQLDKAAGALERAVRVKLDLVAGGRPEDQPAVAYITQLGAAAEQALQSGRQRVAELRGNFGRAEPGAAVAGAEKPAPATERGR